MNTKSFTIYYRRGITGLLFFFVSLFLFSSCEKKEISPDESSSETPTQSFLIKVESVGEVSSHTTTTKSQSRPIYSFSPEQTIDRVDVIIIKRALTAEIVYKGTFTNWSDTENKVSVPYVKGEKRGRQREVVLEGNSLLEEGVEYIAYGVGFHSGTYGGYEPFKGLSLGDKFPNSEMVTVPDGDGVAEIFAGAQSFYVENGEIIANPEDEEISEIPAIRLRRQVAGLMGYYTRIPAVIGEKAVKSIRLVTPKVNKSIIFGGFRSLYDPNDFSKLKVINGFNPRTDYDTRFYGSETNDAFVVAKDIELGKWFPGGEDGMPLDANGDGFLDGEDTNWKVNEELEEAGIIRVLQGSVFNSCYWVPISITQEEADAGIPTFQLQLVGKNDEILTYWNIEVRQAEEFSETRTLVLPGESGIPEVITEENPATPITFNIARNNLYSMGAKNHEQSYGEDEPIDLSTSKDLVIDVNPEWKELETIYFD